MSVLKNHFSLILALFTILFTVQVFFIVDRVIDAYESKLTTNYSIIVISSKKMSNREFNAISELIATSSRITPDKIIKQLKQELKQIDFDSLKTSLPYFYKLTLKHFPTTDELEKLTEALSSNPTITKVEGFSKSHDTIYKLLLLFKKVSDILAIALLAVTSLLIIKELKIWQLQHSERMSIMALFGAPLWLRSAVLFRLAIFDAFIASIIVIGTFSIIKSQRLVEKELANIGIEVDTFILTQDGLTLTVLAILLSVLLASMIVFTHKEES